MTDLVPVTRMVVDTPEGLTAYLESRRASGRLVTPLDQLKASPTTRDPQLWWLRVQVLEPAPKRTWRRWMADLDKQHPIGGPVVKALAFGVAVAAGIFGLAVALFSLALHTIGMHVLLGGAGACLLVLVVIAVSVSGKSHGRHNGKGWHYTDCK